MRPCPTNLRVEAALLRYIVRFHWFSASVTINAMWCWQGRFPVSCEVDNPLEIDFGEPSGGSSLNPDFVTCPNVGIFAGIRDVNVKLLSETLPSCCRSHFLIRSILHSKVLFFWYFVCRSLLYWYSDGIFSFWKMSYQKSIFLTSFCFRVLAKNFFYLIMVLSTICGVL